MSNTPLPIGLSTDHHVIVNDFRGQPFADDRHAVTTCLTSIEAELHKRGWDTPDFFGIVFFGGIAEDGSPTSYLWVAEMEVPGEVHGHLLDILEGLTFTFAMNDESVHRTIISMMVGQQPLDAAPIAVVGSFEATTWPEEEMSRHLVAYFLNDTVTHMVRIKDQEPEFLAVFAPPADSNGAGPDHELIYGGLGLVAGQLIKHFTK